VLGFSNLLTGETSAGKSSFVNLLLSTDLLPIHETSCTSAVCEIRNSANGKKYAVLHYKCEESETYTRPETINLESEKGLSTFSNLITKFDEEMEESPYSWIEVYWPLAILEVR